MSEVSFHSEELERVVASALDVLTHRYGGKPEIREFEDLSGSGPALVARVRIAPSVFLPYRSIVVKHMPRSGNQLDDAAFLSEVVAYQFTTSLSEDVRPGPVLLAYDIESRLVILSDLGQSETLVEVLSSATDSDRERILRQLGEQLGAMHCDTAARELDYRALLKRMLAKHPEYAQQLEQREAAVDGSADLGLKILGRVCGELPAECREFTRDTVALVCADDARAFSPFDVQLDNVVVGSRMSFLDYEWAGFGYVGFDVASLLSEFSQSFPSRPLDPAAIETFVQAWGREVAVAWPGLASEEQRSAAILASLWARALTSVAMFSVESADELFAHVESSDTEELSVASSLWQANDRTELAQVFDTVARYALRVDDERAAALASYCEHVVSHLHSAPMH